jgi:AcrR family transcriptional regulator
MSTAQKMESESRWINPAVQVRSRDSLERILGATARLMATRSFRDIKVTEIAQEADASPTSVYARFENKQALLGALFERHAIAQQEFIGQLLEPVRWRGVPLAVTLRQTFPAIVEGYRAKQGLIRAFLEQASEDARFREAWSEVGDFIVGLVSKLVLSRSFEIDHPNPERAIQLGLGVAFATLAHQIQMHEIDKPQMDELTEELIRMMLRYMGIADVATVTG